MGFFDMFKGAPKGEKKQESDTWQNLSNLFGSTYGAGQEIGKKGNADTGVASNLFTGIAKGDRTALAPAVNAAVEGADAAKREEAQMGTARGGGASSHNQQIEDHTRQLVSSLLGEAQVGAADKLAAIGSGETNSMMNALGIASGTESNLSSLLHKDVSEKNAAAAKMWGSLIKGGLSLATAGMGGGGGLFGKSDPWAGNVNHESNG
jgi:hypothetical protein